MTLPPELEEVWTRGSGASSVKVQVRWHQHDARAAQGHEPPQEGELHLADLGYFDLKRLHSIQQDGAFFLSRLKVGVTLRRSGNSGNLVEWLHQVPPEQSVVEWPVCLPAKVPGRRKYLGPRHGAKLDLLC